MLPRLLKPASYILALVVAFGLGTAIGQQSPPPTENKGFSTEKTVIRDLGGEIEGLQGRQLRLRVLKLDPGGVIGLHSHKDRPGVAYISQGTLTEHRDGGATGDHHAGELLSSGKETAHWEENKGNTAVVIIAADIFKP